MPWGSPRRRSKPPCAIWRSISAPAAFASMRFRRDPRARWREPASLMRVSCSPSSNAIRRCIAASLSKSLAAPDSTCSRTSRPASPARFILSIAATISSPCHIPTRSGLMPVRTSDVLRGISAQLFFSSAQKRGRLRGWNTTGGWTMRIKANDITFNYEIDGPANAPWLVFSNSLATNLSMWDPQAADLGRSFRLLRYDQRGHGGTDTPAGRYTYETLVADARALFDALGIERPHFCGLSMGGATALGLAELYPDRVDRVVVCDSPAMSTPASAQQWEERIAVAQSGGMEALVETTMARWFPPETRAANPRNLEKVRQMIRTTPVNGFIGCAAALADHDYNTSVSTVTRPV